MQVLHAQLAQQASLKTKQLKITGMLPGCK
jgi:hypothetical protein